MQSIKMNQKVQELESWLKTQPQLPHDIDKLLLKRFIYSMHGDVTRTKRLIDKHYKLRAKYHRIFMKRDPLDEDSQKVFEAVDFIELPGKTEDNYKLQLYRFNDLNPAKLNFADVIKVFFMMTDCQFATSFDEATDGEVIIIDMRGYSVQHLTRTNIPALRKFVKFLKEALPVRIKRIHFLNSPAYLEKLLKYFIENQYCLKMQFHSVNDDKFPDDLPRDMLPAEYGGKAGTLDDLRAFWLNQLVEKRLYIIDDTLW